MLSKLNLSKPFLCGLFSLSLLACANTDVVQRSDNVSDNTFESALEQDEQAKLRVATWNIEHLAYPIDSGCKPRTQSEIDAMRSYLERVDADIYALQEVASKAAVHMLFPEQQWQVFMSEREDSEPYICRESGRTSTQQKVAYAVRKGLKINKLESLPEFGLDMPGLRYGLEININTDFGDISLLNVHMKSGCFVDNYSRAESDACKVFAQQAPILDKWIEEKEREDQAYMVLGDFNHRLSAPYNHLTQQLFTNTDGSASSLKNTTADLIGCHPYYPAPIDLIFLGGMQDTILHHKMLAHNFDDMRVEAMLSDHCAVSVDLVLDSITGQETVQEYALSNAVKWQTSSKEYAFLTQAIYQQAIKAINSKNLNTENWVVVMDVDETILDNSPYQVNLDNTGRQYSPETWAQWVKQEEAELVPGVKGFIETVLNKGGKLAFITNRDKTLDAHTWQNLLSRNLPITPKNTCLIGRSVQDTAAIDSVEILNDKDLRRMQVQTGTAECYRPASASASMSQWDLPSQIVMEVGDNIEDFSKTTQEEADAYSLSKQWPERLILLPNPMYGSW
uniref:HAD family acid phosphatase n=1 Tax=Ningiella ruwaisensis TaxID=2364274 RepID=UPI001447E581|nr:HAD family acid phosphatase [Ningiella ruwaisensis]